MQGLKAAEAKKPKERFKWRGRDGEFCDPRSMGTKRLFYIVKMIWNHSMPKHLRFWDEHRYVFSDFYTDAYMVQAFKVCFTELANRKDLGPMMKKKVKYMFHAVKEHGFGDSKKRLVDNSDLAPRQT